MVKEFFLGGGFQCVYMRSSMSLHVEHHDFELLNDNIEDAIF